MVEKQAIPPINSEIGSDRNTPMLPSVQSLGKRITRGVTITTVLKVEKKIACLDLPKATKVVWPACCKAMKINQAKKTRITGIPACMTSASVVTMEIQNSENNSISNQEKVVNKIEATVVNLIQFLTLLYLRAP